MTEQLLNMLANEVMLNLMANNVSRETAFAAIDAIYTLYPEHY